MIQLREQKNALQQNSPINAETSEGPPTGVLQLTVCLQLHACKIIFKHGQPTQKYAVLI